jgi:hypothetical protein
MFIIAFTRARNLSLSKVSVHVRGFPSNNTRFYGEELLAPRPTTKLEDHPLSAVSYYLFIIFAATLHTGGRSFLRNMRTRHVVVTGTHSSRKR